MGQKFIIRDPRIIQAIQEDGYVCVSRHKSVWHSTNLPLIENQSRDGFLYSASCITSNHQFLVLGTALLLAPKDARLIALSYALHILRRNMDQEEVQKIFTDYALGTKNIVHNFVTVWKPFFSDQAFFMTQDDIDVVLDEGYLCVRVPYTGYALTTLPLDANDEYAGKKYNFKLFGQRIIYQTK